ncbi:TIGR03943 family putative permease subunit [Ruminiclostridium cellulolyticum]|uniref:TIGR03943 family protein n=1 Tax=Ruminiclostridium cellulolyticum (strain ATCC 35319 / DSM 5812 / JCM 6584 / H10) TaxID=394503 RepID=B8I8W6_RUMCH|nr:TIGR03943 family protein [Ruminiclostridium cellulolyticum]ACL77298.1 Protein of unknown function DUF1980 [Ruminiclostridium cellulolyticum H10]
MKRLNREVLAQLTVLLLMAALLLHAVAGGKIKYYVNIHMIKYIWFSAAGVIIIALSLLPGLFKPKRRNSILPCVILTIPILAGIIIPPAPVETAHISTGNGYTGVSSATGQIQQKRGKNSSETQVKGDAHIINISDDEYLKWYTEASKNPDKYNSRTVKIKGVVFRMERFSCNEFVPARMSMVCCAADLVPYGFMCRYEDAEKWRNGEWVYVTAKIKVEYEPHMKKKMPILYAISVTPAQKPENELVYPY